MLKIRVKSPYLTCLYVAVLLGVLFFLSTAHPHRAAASASQSDIQRTESVTYVTTAYFLNVRADANNKSKIIDVVSMGTKLSVVAKLSNGWLKLDGGGYIHGGYADPVSKPAPAAPPRTAASQTTSAKPTVVVKTADLKTQKTTVTTADIKANKYKVNARSGLSEADIKALFKGTALAGKGLEKAVLNVEAKYGVNAYFTIAVMRLESGNGGSKLAKSKNNLFGLNSSNGTGYLRFDSKVASIDRFGKLIANNYIGKGYTTIEKISRKYCPANSKWPSLVKSLIDRDVRAV